jgi:hypothetical protein
MSSFSLNSKTILIFFLISSMTHWSLSNVLVSLQLFAYFLLLILLLSSSVIALWQIEYRRLFLFSYICWGLLCALRYAVFGRKFHGLLRRMYIVLLPDEIFCRHQLSPFVLWCHLSLGFLCWIFLSGWPIYWW